MRAPLRVLQVAAEIFPYVKTGGLADVVGALPQALAEQGADVRLLLPGIPAIADALREGRSVVECGPCFGAARVSLRRGQLADSGLRAYVIDAPWLYRRTGGPYQDADGDDWADNLQRFALLGWAAAHLASGELDPSWAPEVVHAHDWHAALTCAYLAGHPGRQAATVFTVHNLAFAGLFPLAEFPLLGLPSRFLTYEGLEYHQQISFMKAGLVYADRVTTVSPTYAREIATPAFGCGLDGVIRSRGAEMSGILNGVDTTVWNPATDPLIAHRYSAEDPAAKAHDKAVLQAEIGLTVRPRSPVFGVVSRLTSQKGLDLLLGALPALLRSGGQLALQGAGEPALEKAFVAAAASHPGEVAVRIGYDEAFAHRLVAGADALLVPSRFEPCGLTQLYALRYGTLPVVRRAGGLADTVVDASGEALREGRATGFVFDEPTSAALRGAIERAVAAYAQPAHWARLMRQAMAQDFSWRGAAERYLELYREIQVR